MSVTTRPAKPAGWDTPFTSTALYVLAALLAVAIGILISGLGTGSAIILPFAMVGAVILGTLAIVRFELFVAAVLILRAALDSTKLHTSGNLNATNGSPNGLDPASILAVLFMVASLVYYAAERRAGREIPNSKSPIRIPLLCFLGAGIISILGSTNPKVSSLECLRVSAVVVMVIVLERLLVKESNLRRLLQATFYSAIIPISFAAIQAVTGKGQSIGGFSRIQGTFLHPNPFSIYLTFIIIMAVAMWPHYSGRAQVPLIVLIGGCSFALLLTYTRSSYIAAVIGVFIVGMYQSKKLVGALLIAVLVVAIAVPSVSQRFSDLQRSQRFSGAAGNSLVWRFSYWKQVASLANQTPVTGIGLKMIEERTDDAKNAHNDFLRVYVETGLLGLTAYAALLISLGLVSRRALKKAKQGYHRGVAVGFFGCYVAFVILSMVSNVISQVVILWYFFTFAVAAFAVSRYGEQSEREEAPLAIGQ
jgi:O-antigen ligase